MHNGLLMYTQARRDLSINKTLEVKVYHGTYASA